MLKRALTAIAVIVGALVLVGLAIRFKPWAKGKSEGSGASSQGAKPPDIVVVDGLKLKPRRLTSTVELLGTVLPNEIVAIAPEVSRRLVKVNFEDGATVKTGDILFELDAADLQAQAGELAARRKLLVETEGRAKRAVASGVGSQVDYDRAHSDLEVLEAQAARLGVDVSRTKLRAPFAGKLGLRNISVGALVRPGDVLITLEDTSRLKVDFLVPERLANTFEPGTKIVFRVQSDPEPHEAVVTASDRRVEEATRSLRVRAVANAVKGMVSGSSVAVTLPVSPETPRLFVPSEVVIPSLGGHAVYVFSEGVAKLADIKIGMRTERDVEIVSGVGSGEVVITSNILRLRPGAKVKLAEVTE